MRILLVVSFYWPATEWGGPAHCVPLLAESIAEIGGDIRVITTTTRGSPADLPVTAGTREIRGVPVTYCDAIGPRRIFFSGSLASSIRRVVPSVDVVHLQGIWTFPDLFSAVTCMASGTPYIISTHGNFHPWSLSQKARKKQFHLWLIGRRALRAAAAIHFTSSDEQKMVPPFLASLPGEVLPNPVDIDLFSRVEGARDHGGPLRLLILGRIHQKKGFDLLLPAMAQIAAHGTETCLRIAGPDEGGYATEVRQMAQELSLQEKIQFLGNLDREALFEQLQHADAVVMPSYQENFGMAAAEAMAGSRVVMVSDQVNLAREIQQANAGLVVPLTTDGVAAGICKLAESAEVRRKMGEAGRVWARTHCDRLVVAKRMCRIYETATRKTRIER